MDGLEIPKNTYGVAERPKIINIQLIMGRIFVSLKRFLFLKYLQTIYFSFYIKYAWENVGIRFFGNIFFGRPCHSNGIKILLDVALVFTLTKCPARIKCQIETTQTFKCNYKK